MSDAGGDLLVSDLSVCLLCPSEKHFPNILLKSLSSGSTERSCDNFEFPSFSEVTRDENLRLALERLSTFDRLSQKSAYAKGVSLWKDGKEQLLDGEYRLILCCDYYVALDYFDFVLNDNLSNLFICDTANNVGDLFSKIDPDGKVLKLERFNPTPPAPEDVGRQVAWLHEAADVRLFTMIFWRNAPMPAEVSARSYVGFLRNISIAHFLEKRGIPVYVDLLSTSEDNSPDWPLGISPGMLPSLSDNSSNFEKMFATYSGFDNLIALTPKDRNMTAYTTAYPDLHRVFSKKSWPSLLERFPIDLGQDPGDAILFIDQPLWAFPDLDFEKTRRNVEIFLLALRERGAIIHAKPHPSWPDRTILQGTSISFDALPFPKWLPGEYVVNRYRTVLFFFSMAAAEADPEGRFSMLDLLEFESEEAYEHRFPACQEVMRRIGPVKGEISMDQLDDSVEKVISRIR